MNAYRAESVNGFDRNMHLAFPGGGNDLGESLGQRIAVPTMTIAASGESNLWGWTSKGNRAASDGGRTRDNYEVLIKAHDHHSLFGAASDAAASAQRRSQQPFQHVEAVSLAFWDAYLKGDLAAQRILESDKLSWGSHGEVRVRRTW
jgi:hypothetical protein